MSSAALNNVTRMTRNSQARAEVLEEAHAKSDSKLIEKD